MPDNNPLSPKALALILEFEGGAGIDQPSKWPGEQSGISLGYGYDLGYNTADQFVADWGEVLPAEQIAVLKTVVGIKGTEARDRAGQFAQIRIKEPDAKRVLVERTVPRFYEETRKAFPGLEKLPADAQGALVSLVFNRGTSVNGPRRTEMLAIKNLLQAEVPDKKAIADQIRAMKRLWPNTAGLRRRRDAEADLIEQA